MKVLQMIFSPTGGTEQVADIITEKWRMPVNKIDLSNAEIDYSALNLEKTILQLLRYLLMAAVYLL